jgi:hypothetical protein
MPYKISGSGYAGYPDINSTPIAAPATGAYPAAQPSLLVPVADPVWGFGEAVFGRANGAIRQFGLCVCLPVWDSTNKVYTQNFTEAPNTAILGRPLYVAQCTGALASGEYGWFLSSGISPINGTVSVAADTAIGITAAGQVGTLAAGKQLNNARCVGAATTTVASAGSGVSGGTEITVANSQGFFPGAYLSGTGVGAASIVSAVNGNKLTVTVANSAAISGNVTATYNNSTIFYNIVQFNRLAAQGPIT